MSSGDINMQNMVGASNKAFDYMAAGLPLLVSQLDSWVASLIKPGFAIGCDPEDPASIASALRWLVDHPSERRAMGIKGRARIELDWNYEKAFAPVVDAINAV
jgi:glycosyltransferase involved in cell wall biosynthesis